MQQYPRLFVSLSLSTLQVKEVDEDFQRHSYFSRASDGTVTKLQKGVIRTNCLDNLDRTNVVQSLFGRRSLLIMLEQHTALQGNVLESPHRDFENVFKDVWGNNADAISILYSGTGALKVRSHQSCTHISGHD